MYTKEFRKEEIKGWGNYPKAYGKVFRPERLADLVELFNREKGTILARGGGTSYGDASINVDGLNIDTRRLNKMLYFDAVNGNLHCQAGVTLQDIISTFLPKGWFLHVTPGSQFSTVGGCVACDAHGKNWKAGSFGSYVRGFNLMLHDGSIIYCDESNNSNMYYATIGGMGMTGVILDVNFQLKKVTSSYVDVDTIRFHNLRELFDLQNDSRDSHHYIFAWLDSHKEGEDMGRGVLQRADHSNDGELFYTEKRRINVPVYLPQFTINRYSVESFNALYYAKAKFNTNKQRLYLEDYFYPLDTIGNWYRIYGKRGFIEYQVAIPSDNAYETIFELLKKITKSKLGSTVAAIKPLKKSKGLISFPIDGYTLAVDFPHNDKLWQLLDELDIIVVENGGRVYLSKDARLNADNFKKMYANSIVKWESVRDEYKVTDKFTSLMFSRLNKA